MLTAVTAYAATTYQVPNANFEDWSAATFDGEPQPQSWHASNVEQVGMQFNFAHKETGRSGYCMMVQDQSVGAMGISETSPGYFALGKPWAYLPGITSINKATAGTSGGIQWTTRPDTMSVWIKRTGDNTDKEDFYLLLYSWTGTAKSNKYKGKDGTCTSHEETNEESDIRIALNHNECGTTQKATQIAEGMWRERKTYGNWTNIRVPIYYLNDQVPQMLNIIFSASNYPNYRANSGLYTGNSLYVDDVEMIYASTIDALYVGGKEWKGFDPKSKEVQVYSLGETATAIPEIVAKRGVGTLTNASGESASFLGRTLSGSEITITKGDLEKTPTTITVKSEDGKSTTTYKIQFQKAASSNAKLAGLEYTLDGVTTALSNFNPSNLSYTVELPYGTKSVPTVSCTYAEDGQTSAITQPASTTGKATIVVTAANGQAKQTYTIQFSIGLLKDNTLKDILVNDKSVPGFSPNQTVYKVSLPTTTTSMPTVKAVSAYADGEQTITYTAPSTFDGGTYQISVTTPGNSTPKVYKLNFKVEASSYAYLNDLQVVGDQVEFVNPAKPGDATALNFTPDNTTYYINLKMGTKTMPNILWTPGDEFQTITKDEGGLDGTTRINVVAGNKADQTVYKLVFATAKSEISTLAGINIDGKPLAGFASDITSYTYQLPVGTTKLPEIEAIKGDEYQDVTVTTGGVSGKTRITVVAGNGNTTNYYITFSVETFTDNTLAALSVAGNDLQNANGETVVFDPEVNEYWVNLPKGTTVLPEVSYTLQNAEFQSASERTISGLNGDYKITVRPRSGASRTYIIHFSVATSSNTKLDMIYLDGTPLPGFDPDVLAYDTTLAEGVSTIPAVTFKKAEDTQRVLSVLENKVQTITVTAQSGATRTYTVTFTVQVSQNAQLEMIYLDSVELAGFRKDSTEYLVKLEGDRCPAITVDKAPGQQVTITAPFAAGKATIQVQPEEGAAQTYTIEFEAVAAATARLKNILVGGTQIAGWDPTTMHYAVGYENELPEVTFEKEYDEQSVKLLWKGDVAYLHVADTLGNKAVYDITFTRTTSSNNSLLGIYANGSLIDEFATDKLSYDFELAAGSSYPEISYKVAENAQVVFFGQLADGKWGITVIAEGGQKATYTVQYTILPYADATLKDLKLNGTQISGFAPATTTYNQTIDEGAALPKVTVETRPGQRVLLYDKDDSHQEVVVYAESGATNTYKINYTREESSNANLRDILIDGVSLAGFDSTIVDYTDSLAWRTKVVPNVFPIGDNENQTITTTFSRPNGVTKILVKAQDGTTKEYRIAFPVKKSSNTKLGDLYLDGDDGEIKSFKPDQTDYEVTLSYEATTCPKMVFEKDEDEQRIDVISRPIGETSQIIVTAENGDTRTYNIHFKRGILKTANRLTSLILHINDNEDFEQELNLKDKTKRDFDVTLPYGARKLVVEYEKSYPEQTVFIQPGGVNAPTIITVKANNDTIADEVYTINPIKTTQNPAILNSIKVDGVAVDGFDPNRFTYIVNRSTKSYPKIEYTKNQGVETEPVSSMYKWECEVAKDGATNKYVLFFHYTNEIIPNAHFTSWEKAVYNDGDKPTGWQVPADFFEKVCVISCSKTGAEVVKNSDTRVGLETTYWSAAGGALPAIITLGKLSGAMAVDNKTHYEFYDYIDFHNTPDLIRFNYYYKKKKDNGGLFAFRFKDANNTEYNFDTIVPQNSAYVTATKKLVLDGKPLIGMNIAVDATNASSGASSSAALYVDWFEFCYNSKPKALKINGKSATLSGKKFTVTLDDSEDVNRPSYEFNGEVSDQAQLLNWVDPVVEGDYSVRRATFTNYAEDGSTTDGTGYSIEIKRPLDTKNQLANLLLDTNAITGWSPTKKDYTIPLEATRRGLPSIQPVPGSSLQKVVTAFSEADSTMTITVTPEKGDSTVYKVKFTTVVSNDTTLANITATGVSFDPDTKEYEIEAAEMPIITFEKKSDLQVVTLNNGVITVTAEDGVSTGTYTIVRKDTTAAVSGVITEFSLGKNVISDLGGTTMSKEAAKPTEYISFIRKQATDTVVFVQAPDKMTWTVPTKGGYSWTYPTDLSANADLAALLINGDTIEGFTTGDVNFEIITNETKALDAIVAEEAQKIASSFNEADTTMTITVTAEDGTTNKTYTVKFIRPVSDLTELAGIMLDSVMIDGFRPDSFTYVVTLPVPAVKKEQPKMPSVTYVAGHEGQQIPVKPGVLNGDPTEFEVYAENGAGPSYYSLTINAEKSHCSDLTGITVNGEALDHFESGRHFYSVSLNTEDINLDYTADDRFLKVDTIIEVVKAHHEYHYTLRVTAEDGSTSDYLIEIYVENQSTDAQLANITLDGLNFVDFRRDINPDVIAFDGGNNTYDFNLPSGTTVLPEVSGKLKMDGQSVEIEQFKDSVLLTVTAADGSTKNVYHLNFHVPLSTNANLSMIFLNGDSLPNFDPNYYFYQIDLPVGTHDLPEVVGQKDEAGQTILPVEIDNDKLQATIKVQAEDPTTRLNTYVVVFHFRQSDADTLNVIYENGDTLAGFEPHTFYYTNSLPVGTTAFPSLDYEVADEWQTVKLDTVEATASTLIRQIMVISESGKKNTYTVSYNILKSDVDTLQMIFVDQKQLPGFQATKEEYYYQLTSAEAAALNGQLPVVEYNSGDEYQTVLVSQALDSLSGKSLGYKSLVTVTAATGKSRTYTIHYPVELSSEATLNMILLAGKPLANYDAERSSYKVDIALEASVPVVSVLKKEDAQTYEIRVDGDTVRIDVWAEDMTPNSYVLTFDRVKSDNALLSNIILTDAAGKQLPYELFDFSAHQNDYDIVLPYNPEATELVLPNIKTVLADSLQVLSIDTIPDEKGVETKVIIRVTAPDGENENSYILTFFLTRNNDASLVEILLGGTALEGFDAELTNYTYSHPFGSDSTAFFTLDQVEAITNDPKATASIAMAEDGTITIEVVAQNEETKISYTIVQEIGKDRDNLLKMITINGDSLRGFDANVTFYTYLLRSGTSTIPEIEGIPNSDNAMVEITKKSVNDTTILYCTAQDGSERAYKVLFKESDINDALAPTANDVFIRRVQGAMQLFVATIRKDVTFVLHDQNGRLLYFEKVPDADPNDVVVDRIVDQAGKEQDVLLNVTDMNSGLVVDILPHQIYFYSFVEAGAKIIKSGKLMAIE